MPHLQFEINRPLEEEDKITFARKVRRLFSETMGTGTDHICISIREFGTHNLSIGRASEPEKGVAVVNADIREGRSMEQRRALTLGFMDLLAGTWGIPRENMYVTLTEHRGEDFHLAEKFLANWQEGEDPLADQARPGKEEAVMRKRMIGAPGDPAPAGNEMWLDLERLAITEISSEDPEYPIESALRPGIQGWRAAHGGEQVVRFIFDEPQRIRRIRLIFQEDRQPRTQEFTLAWSGEDERPREIVRQQYNFSPPDNIRQTEDYQVELPGAKAIELQIRPDISGGNARASLQLIQIA